MIAMLADAFIDRLSEDWLWRERELRELDRRLMPKNAEATILKSVVLVLYAHWEGMFKFAASETFEFLCEGIDRRIFGFDELTEHIRLRLAFCSYRRSTIGGQSQERFLTLLASLREPRFSGFRNARDEVVMIDDNLSAARAGAICENFGVESDWVLLKKTLLDARLLEPRNAIAHGSKRLRSGLPLDLVHDEVREVFDEIRPLVREAKDRFANAIALRSFIVS